MTRPAWGDNFKKISRSEEGHIFERVWRKKIFEKLKTWRSVTMRLGNGDLLTSQNLEQKSKGADLLIDVKAKNRAAGRRMANKIIKTIEDIPVDDL